MAHLHLPNDSDEVKHGVVDALAEQGVSPKDAERIAALLASKLESERGALVAGVREDRIWLRVCQASITAILAVAVAMFIPVAYRLLSDGFTTAAVVIGVAFAVAGSVAILRLMAITRRIDRLQTADDTFPPADVAAFAAAIARLKVNGNRDVA